MTTPTARTRVRVTVTDVWDTVVVEADADRSLAEVKREALTRALGRPVAPTGYVIKYRGGLIHDEARSVADLAIPDGAALVVLPAARRPVR